jgi:phosphatidylinositol kinase/protein kinase (PI-3  family)
MSHSDNFIFQFQVAMTRDKHPEKIPFRLTRMLIRAMEVSGIEGNFRFTAENVMRVLRENKDSVMAVLEAFVYDPLINWRLLQGNESRKFEEQAKTKSNPATAESGKAATFSLYQSSSKFLLFLYYEIRIHFVHSFL